MIKKYLDQDTINTILNGIEEYYQGKKLILVDMDGVVADFEALGEKLAAQENMSFQEWADQKKYRQVDNFYQDLPLIPGAKESILKLQQSGKYEIIFVSAPSWGNISCFSDKRIWFENNFPSFKKKMDLSYHKGHYFAHYLIDDRTKYGVNDFIGKHIHFGGEEFPSWEEVLNYLI